MSDELTSLAMPHAPVDDRRHAAGDPGAGGRPPGRSCSWSAIGCAATVHGVDDVEFLLAANTGAEARPLHKGASGR